MQKCLIVIGLFVLAIGLRSARKAMVRKAGAVVFLAASFLSLFFLTACWWWGAAGVAVWFFLPWVELLTRIRRMRLPLENRLRQKEVPDPAFSRMRWRRPRRWRRPDSNTWTTAAGNGAG